MFEKVTYYIEVPIWEFNAVSGWTKWESPHRWDFGSWEETERLAQSEFDTLEEAKEAVEREELTCYRIIEERHMETVVDSQYRC